jgi:hypothetical protein
MSLPVRLVRRLAWPLLAVTAGCTAAKAQLEILSAEEGLRRAEDYDAQRIAVYEYVMAAQYLDKAREEAGFSAYRLADELARRSAQWSDRAIIFVERRGREEIDLRGLTDQERELDAPLPVLDDTDDRDDPDDPDEIDDLDDEIDIPGGGR